MQVEKAAPLISPAYDVGATEEELRRTYRAYFESIQPKDWSGHDIKQKVK
jgi:hypothetical protein